MQRIVAPDLARGFMLLGIALANVSAYLWARPVVDGTLHVVGGNVLDRALSTAVIVLVDQRVYPMFAFLFGYGIVQFTRSRIAHGVPMRGVQTMLRRRHLWLIVFGGLHALLLFSGDILGAYGLAGLILTAIFWGASDKAITITVRVFVGLAALGAMLLATAGAIALIIAPVISTVMLPSTDVTAGFDSPTTADLMNGQSNYFFGALERLGTWTLATPASLLGLLVPAAVLLGMVAARHRWLEGAAARANLGTVAAGGIAIGVIGALPTSLVYLDLLPGIDGAGWALSGVGQVTGFFGGIGYVALFGVIGRRLHGRLAGGLGAVAAIGKRSLTFYLLQSVIFAPLLAAWGLGLGASIGQTGAYGLAAGVWLLSLPLAAWLERRRKRGPAEILLRRLTYGRDPEPRMQM